MQSAIRKSNPDAHRADQYSEVGIACEQPLRECVRGFGFGLVLPASDSPLPDLSVPRFAQPLL